MGAPDPDIRDLGYVTEKGVFLGTPLFQRWLRLHGDLGYFRLIWGYKRAPFYPLFPVPAPDPDIGDSKVFHYNPPMSTDSPISAHR